MNFETFLKQFAAKNGITFIEARRIAEEAMRE